MEAIILAGGMGTRLKAVVPDLPKPMAPVAGRPFLEILLTGLAKKGFHRIILAIGYMAEKIAHHFDSTYAGMEIQFVVETHPLGTGGALQLALAQSRSDHVFVLNGDTYLDLEVDAIERQWQFFHLPIIVARHVPNTARYGRLETTNNLVAGFAEKSIAGAGLINAGCYVLPSDILQGCTLIAPFSFETDFLAFMVKERDFCFFTSNGQFIDIGIPEDYARAQIELPTFK